MKKFNLIVGITGTLGAGKGATVEFLQQKYQFLHYSVRGFLSKILEEQSIEITRDSLTEMGNKLRAQYGGDYIIQQMLEDAQKEVFPVVIESIRSKTEVDLLLQNGIPLIAIDADQPLRYERILQRLSETDDVSYEKFCEDEAREMYNTDPLKQNLVYAMSKANFHVKNNSTLDHLEKQVKEILTTIQESVRV